MNKKDIIDQDLIKYNADAVIISNDFNRYWYTNFHSSAGYIIVTKNKSYLLIDNRYFEAAKQQVLNCEVLLFKSLQDLKDLINKLEIKEVIVEKEYITLETLETYWKMNLKTIGIESRYWRIVKDESAIKALTKAAQIAADTIEWLRKQPIIGKTEKEVATMIAVHMLELGATGNSFDSIVATGKNGAIPHHVPDDTILEEGNLVTVDIGCMYDYYASDITRTFALGNKLNDPKLEELYYAVLEANLKGIEAAKIGNTGEVVDKVCREYIDNIQDFKGYFTHATGHGVGLEVHELPYVSPRARRLLEKNNVCTIEPGIYIPGLGGARIEDTIIITDNEANIITSNAKKNLYNE